jgi:hypothetical protein
VEKTKARNANDQRNPETGSGCVTGNLAEAERIIVLKSGQTSNVGRRWRLRVSGEIYAALLGGTQDSALNNH